jgi:hypothetical protein
VYTNMPRVRFSFTDRLILSIFGSLYMTVIGIGVGLGGCIVIREVEQKINPRTPEYLAKEKKKELIKYINGDKRRIEEHEKTIESFNRYKESEHQNNTVRDIKAEIEYLNRSIDRWEHEKEVLDDAFCLIDKEPAPLMPIEMGFRRLLYSYE